MKEGNKLLEEGKDWMELFREKPPSKFRPETGEAAVKFLI